MPSQAEEGTQEHFTAVTPRFPEEFQRRANEGFLHWKLRLYSYRHPRRFNAIGEAMCRTLGHSFAASHCVEIEVAADGSKQVSYVHFCPVCCTMSLPVDHREIVRWRVRHGLDQTGHCTEWSPRLSYAWRTLSGHQPDPNNKKRIYAVFPL